MTFLTDENSNEIRALNGARVVILDDHDTELLHLNRNVTLIKDGALMQLSYQGVSAIVDTDYYVVGTCQAFGNWNTAIASKASIIAAQQSTGEPLVETYSYASEWTCEGGESESAVSASTQKSVKPLTAAVEATETPKTPTRGCFSGIILR